MTSVKYDYSFLAGMYTSNKIILNSYTLNLHLYINTQSTEDQQIAFNRMDYVIYDIVANSIFVEETDIKTIKKLKKAGINVLTLSDPGAIDQIVQVTLVNKLNLVTDDKINIFESEITSSVGGYVKYMYYSNDEIPEHNNQYELISSDPRKWWNDAYPRFESNIEGSKICNFDQAKTWKDLDLGWEIDNITDIPEISLSNIITMKRPDNENR